MKKTAGNTNRPLITGWQNSLIPVELRRAVGWLRPEAERPPYVSAGPMEGRHRHPLTFFFIHVAHLHHGAYLHNSHHYQYCRGQ